MEIIKHSENTTFIKTIKLSFKETETFLLKLLLMTIKTNTSEIT